MLTDKHMFKLNSRRGAGACLAAALIALIGALALGAPGAAAQSPLAYPEERCIKGEATAGVFRGVWRQSDDCRSIESAGNARGAFYTAEVAPGQRLEYNINLKDSGGASGEIRIYDADLYLIAESYTNGYWLVNSSLTKELRAGFYYIEILACDRESCVTNKTPPPDFIYELHISVKSVGSQGRVTGLLSCDSELVFGERAEFVADPNCYWEWATAPERRFYGLYVFETARDALIELDYGGANTQAVLLNTDNSMWIPPTRSSAGAAIYDLDRGNYELYLLNRSAAGFEFDASKMGRDLNGEFEPLIGGVDIGCTLGFPISVAATETAVAIDGVAVNSHCTDNQGSQDNTQLTQGGRQITATVAAVFGPGGGVEFVIGELADSRLYNDTTPTDLFVREYDKLICEPVCSYSDAAFFQLEDGITTAPRIARPAMRNRLPAENFGEFLRINPDQFEERYLTLDANQPYFTIVGATTVGIDDVVHKVGSTTGWTTGRVVRVCQNQGVKSDEYGTILHLCQNSFESLAGNVVSGSGDSGSPVFKCVEEDDFECRSGNVLLVGILHSSRHIGEVDGIGYGTKSNFSPLSNVAREFDRDAGGCWTLTATSDCISPAVQYAAACLVINVELGVVIDGNWAEACPSVNGGDRARHYAFELPADKTVSIDAQSEFGSPGIRLINGSAAVNPDIYGKLLQSNNRGRARYSTSEFESERIIVEIFQATGAGGSFDLVINDSAADRVALPPIAAGADGDVSALPSPDVVVDDAVAESNAGLWAVIVGALAIFLIAAVFVAAKSISSRPRERAEDDEDGEEADAEFGSASGQDWRD